MSNNIQVFEEINQALLQKNLQTIQEIIAEHTMINSPSPEPGEDNHAIQIPPINYIITQIHRYLFPQEGQQYIIRIMQEVYSMETLLREDNIHNRGILHEIFEAFGKHPTMYITIFNAVIQKAKDLQGLDQLIQKKDKEGNTALITFLRNITGYTLNSTQIKTDIVNIVNILHPVINEKNNNGIFPFHELIFVLGRSLTDKNLSTVLTTLCNVFVQQLKIYADNQGNNLEDIFNPVEKNNKTTLMLLCEQISKAPNQQQEKILYDYYWNPIQVAGIQKHINLKLTDSNKQSILHYALREGDHNLLIPELIKANETEAFEYLMQAVNINNQTPFLYALLLYAFRDKKATRDKKAQLKTVRFLLDSISPEAKTRVMNNIDKDNVTTLIAALQLKDIDILQYLISLGIDLSSIVNVKDSSANTALFYAFESQQTQIAKFFFTVILKKINVEEQRQCQTNFFEKNNQGITPFMLIWQLGDKSFIDSCMEFFPIQGDIIQKYLEVGEFLIKNDSHKSFSTFSSHIKKQTWDTHPDFQNKLLVLTAKLGRKSIANVLFIDHKADPLWKNITSQTAIDYTVERQDTSMLQMLLKSQKNTNEGNTLLHEIAKANVALFSKIAQTFTQATNSTFRTMLSDRNQAGDTPLHVFAKFHDPKIVAAAADLSVQNDQGLSSEQIYRINNQDSYMSNTI